MKVECVNHEKDNVRGNKTECCYQNIKNVLESDKRAEST